MTRKEKREQKMRENRKSGKFKKLNLFTGVLLGMYITISIFLVYNLFRLDGIENAIRYVVMFLFIISDVYLLLRYIKMRFKPLLSKYILFIFLLLIAGTIEFFVAYTIDKGLNVVDNISQKKYRTYSTSIIALKDGNLKEIKDVTSDTKIGRVSDTNDVENYKLTKYLMKKDSINESQIEEYDDPFTMLYDLYDKKVDAVFISGSFDKKYGTVEKFENIKDEVVVLDTYSKKMKIQKDELTMASTKSVTEPFTLLLMGVDSTEEDLSKGAALGDSLMLITFNPKTLNATILSIPRDTYVPITCYSNAKSKITHAASGGDKCMINTIQNAFDINIDYYAKINFLGLMKLVDAMGGVDVEVPYSFCETTMWRSEEYMVYVDEGMQHLNGEQALALSRNRKTYKRCGAKYSKGPRNDFIRGQNQQLVISSIMNKAKNLDNISQFYGILDAVGSSMTTNMDRKQILSFYNVFKNVLLNSKSLTDGNDIINMQKMYLNGSGGLYPDGIMSMDLYEYIPSTQSMNAIIKAMKVNLEISKEEPVLEFEFSADEPYEQEVIGKNLSGGVDVPNKSNNSSSSSSCDDGEELGADKTTCVCKWGYTRNSSGKCVEEASEGDDLSNKSFCGAHSTYNKSSQICECDYGYEKDLTTSTCVLKGSSSSNTDTSGSGSNTDTDSGTTDPVSTDPSTPDPGQTNDPNNP